MKLSHSLDLETIKAAANARINRAFAVLVHDALGAVASIYTLKDEVARAVLAAEALTHYLLEPEAAARGCTVKELAQTIVDKAEATKHAVFELELKRQDALRRVRKATSEQEINSI